MAPAVEPRVNTNGDQMTCPVLELLNTPAEPPTLLSATAPEATELSSVDISVKAGAYKPGVGGAGLPQKRRCRLCR